MAKRKKIFIKKIQDLEKKSSSHHYFFTGKSILLLEQNGYKVIDFLETNGKMTFKGIVKHFSIELPYFDNQREAGIFLEALKESVAIARDCYDQFAGIILIECNEEWAKYGANDAMKKVLEYLRTLSSVRFVVLAPNAEENGSVYTAFSTVGIWACMKVEYTDSGWCIKDCIQKINAAGLSISEQVKTELCSIIEQHQEEIIDTRTMLTQWVDQIIINRCLKECKDKAISNEDLELLSWTTSKKPNYTIGFTNER